MSHSASRYAASRCGSTTSSKVGISSFIAASVPLRRERAHRHPPHSARTTLVRQRHAVTQTKHWLQIVIRSRTIARSNMIFFAETLTHSQSGFQPAVRYEGMTDGALRSFGAHLRAHREHAGFTQDELATIAGLSVHAVSALERGERRCPQFETVRALSAALDLTGTARDAFVKSARGPILHPVFDEPSATTLPQPLTALLGRDADMLALRRLLDDRRVRLLTLVGTGGVGKTRLALELARTIAGERAWRVLFVSLAAVRDPALVAATIADSLGLTDVSALDLPERARLALGDHVTLLVIDNFEQVLDAAPLASELLAAVPSLRLLVTSRAPLHVRGEREYALAPLELNAGSETMPLTDLAIVPAVRLFVDRVRDVQPDFRLTHANGPSVAAICRRLDGLPLALELAAPWIKVLTVGGLLRHLEHDLLLGGISLRDVPERQQTMNATVAWSYQLLEPEQQSAFRRFGALPGSFSIDEAEAVLAGRDGGPAAAEDALRAVSVLIDKSLLHRSEASVTSGSLYVMLETVRAYALEEL